MNPERWRQARQIFEEALDREAPAREAFVRQACEGDQRLFEEVASLLASYDQADDDFLNPVIEGVATADRMEGRELGPYRLLHRLGQGGMGAVYLAERADEQYRKRVALKLVRPGYDDGHLLRRFSNERQLLAVLDHPNIVKLLDAGVTGDGIPYFVMDYVEGQPIDEFCQSRDLSIPERLELFREVCAAVHCAHRNLVVHRDLKPSNILVTPEGSPRLLDFGIAKLLRPEYSSGAIGLTRTMQPMTAQFASPEQVTGQPITTSSDVYSLGVLLYRLVAGRHPYEMNTNSAAEVERAICETQPARPSVVAKGEGGRKGLGSDVDNIVLMAMRKEPQRRYPSAEHLSEDIRRYLGNQPVSARKDTLLYRASKFVSRNRVGVIAGAVAMVALIASAVIAVYEKAAAAEQRAVAAERLGALRKYAKFMLDLDDTLRQSVTAGRKELLEKTAGQFAAMAKEAGKDQSLMREAAAGFLRTAQVQGNPLAPNLAEYDHARENYERVLELGHAMAPGAEADRVTVAGEMGLGRLDAFSGSRANAEAHYQTALHLYEKIHSQRGVMIIWQERGQLQQARGDLPGAIESYGKSLQLATRLDQVKSTAKTRSDVENEWLLYGLALGRAGRTEESLQALKKTLTIARGLADADPSRRREVAATQGGIGFVLNRAGQTREALDSYEEAVRLCEKLARSDAHNLQAQIDLGQMKGEMAEVLWNAKRNQEAGAASASAIELLEPVVDREDAAPYFLQQYAAFLLAPSNGNPAPAAALKFALRADKLEQHSNPESLQTVAAALAATGDQEGARETAKRALDTLPAGADPYLRKNLERWSSAPVTGVAVAKTRPQKGQ